MMKNQLAGLMKQAQQMQDNMKKVQDSLADIEVEGQSGAGLNDALRRAEQTAQEKMSAVTAGLPLPPGFKMPF